MKLKKLGLLLTATLLSAALLAGCSSDAESTAESTDTSSDAAVVESSAAEATAKTMDEMFTLLSEANPIANPRELDDMSITLDFMLSLDDIVAYQGVASNDGGDAGMIVILEVAEGKADTVLAAMETYAENQAVFWANYDEFADAEDSVKNSLILCEGNYIIQVFATTGADYADIQAVLDELFA